MVTAALAVPRSPAAEAAAPGAAAASPAPGLRGGPRFLASRHRHCDRAPAGPWYWHASVETSYTKLVHKEVTFNQVVHVINPCSRLGQQDIYRTITSRYPALTAAGPPGPGAQPAPRLPAQAVAGGPGGQPGRARPKVAGQTYQEYAYAPARQSGE